MTQNTMNQDTMIQGASSEGTRPESGPTRYTSKSEVGAALRPVFELAQDIAGYIAPNWRSAGDVLAHIKPGRIETSDHSVRAVPDISNHRRLKLEAALSSQGTDVLLPLNAMLQRLAPLNTSEADLTFEVGLSMHRELQIRVTMHGIEVFAGRTLKALIRDIYAFIRTHENLDMQAELQPYILVTDHALDATQLTNTQIYADTAEHALLRCAACCPQIRWMIRAGRQVQCRPLCPKVDPRLAKVLDGRTRKAPAPAKDWSLQ